MKENFFTKLLNNDDPSVNSKLFSAAVGLILLIALVVGHLSGIAVGVEFVYAIIGFILALQGISKIPSKTG